MRAGDALKYAAAMLRERTNLTLDGIAACDCCAEDHEMAVDAIYDVVHMIRDLAARCGDPRRYSDGRLVTSRAEIEYGLVTEHVWHPEPASESPTSWRGDLPFGDPDMPSPGRFEVTTDPATQSIHTRVVRRV